MAPAHMTYVEEYCACESAASTSRVWMIVGATLSAWGSVVLLCACSETRGHDPSKTKPSYEVMITAHRDETEAMGGVEVFQDARSLGTTDGSGALRAVLSGTAGETAALIVKCPSDFTSPEEPIYVRLWPLAPGSVSPRFDAECKPLVHSLVLGLRAEHGAGLPVVRLGKTVAMTDPYGVTHFSIEARTSEQITITLDTTQNRELRPQNPTLTFVAADRDELVLLDQRFTVKRSVIRTPKREIPRRL